MRMCSSVGRALDSKSKSRRFKSGHVQIIIFVSGAFPLESERQAFPLEFEFQQNDTENTQKPTEEVPQTSSSAF